MRPTTESLSTGGRLPAIPLFKLQPANTISVSGQRRTNEYTANPVSDRYRHCLFDWLAAHAPLWNQLTYRRRQQYFTDDGDVWEADFADLYDDYAPILGKAACQ